MVEHVCDRCVRCTDEAKTEVGYRLKYDSYLGQYPTAEPPVYITIFASPQGRASRKPLCFVGRNKCCLPRNGLLSGAASIKEYSSHGECSHPKGKWAKETAPLNSRASRLAVLEVKDDGSCKSWRKGPRCLHPYSTGSVKFLRVALKRIGA